MNSIGVAQLRPPHFEQIERAIRSCEASVPAQILPDQSLVSDFAFDSLAIARLGVALEDQLGRRVLLDEWLQSCVDPQELTVGSLCAFLTARPG